jgi:hypothetical protein
MKKLYLFILSFLFVLELPAESSILKTNAPDEAILIALDTNLGNATSPITPSQTEYHLRDATPTESIVMITPYLSNSSATMQISINGGTSASLVSGNSSDPLPLNFGDNTITLIVSMDGKSDLTYEIKVQRLASSNANLSSVTTSAGSPTTDITDLQSQYYLLDVASDVSLIYVTAYASSTDASMQIKVNSGSYANLPRGISSAGLPLNYGNNIVEILVTAQNQTTRAYTFTVRRTASNDANLSSVLTSIGVPTSNISPDQSDYFLPNVAHNVSSIMVTAYRSNMHASMQIRINNGTYTNLSNGESTGALSLNVGDNTIEILVTAQDLTTRKYKFMTRKAASSDATLSTVSTSLDVSAISISPSKTQYILTDVESSVTSLTVTASTTDLNASMQIRINGEPYVPLADGTSSGALSLNIGVNTIDILVTAQDITSYQTYSFTVRRNNRFTDTDLSSITISGGTLSPTFSPEVLSYTMIVPHSTASINMAPSLVNTGAIIEIKINDDEYITLENNTESGALQLNVGENTILIRITLPDGPLGKNVRVAEVSQVYEIIVTRNNPLPVTLIAFRGKSSGTTQATLSWVTADEQDFFAFEIQKSTDGKNFEKVGEIAAKQANGSYLNTYTFIDHYAQEAAIYYRLKMIDTDKSFIYSRIISINNNEPETGVVGEFYPNPVLTENVSIDIVATEPGRWKINAVDILGTERHMGEKELTAGENKVSIPAQSIKTGINLIRFENNGKSFIRRIIRL